MDQLEELDKSMKQLYLDLTRYSEDDLEHQKTLSKLNQQYQMCKLLLAFRDDGKNNTYSFQYSDIGAIEQILATAGYIEQSKKASTR